MTAGRWWEDNESGHRVEFKALTPAQIKVLVETLDRLTNDLSAVAEKSWSTLGLDLSNQIRGDHAKLNRQLREAFPDLKK